jgi:hypothetical protein
MPPNVRMLNEQSYQTQQSLISIRDRAINEQFIKNKSAAIDMFMRTKLKSSKPIKINRKGAMESEVSVILST